jgi:putative FmdB family regulatory protein|tara:strand:- start:1274 stop:1585 length:312 start_codon:yes stop_codon:yes gene_type:complete
MSPLYEYFCDVCHEESERHSSVKDMNNQECDECGISLRKEIRSLRHDGGYERKRYPFYCEHLDKVVESKSHHDKAIKDKGWVRADSSVRKEKRGTIYSIPKAR